MPRTKTGTPPKYRHHKPRNLAKVTIQRRDIYLGEFQSPESWRKYGQIVSAWSDHKTFDEIKAILAGKLPFVDETDHCTDPLTVGQLSLRYWNEHAAEYFKSSTGLSHGRVPNAKLALREVNDLFADKPATQFTPVDFRQVREAMVARGLTRRYINDAMWHVIDLFRWGVESNLVDPLIPAALREVRTLRAGKTKAKESIRVLPVERRVIRTTLRFMPKLLRDMVRVQLLIGARPNEVCQMRASEITIQSAGIWCYRPAQHKTKHRGKDRRLFIGPKAQRYLRRYIDSAKEDLLFTHTWYGDPKPYERENYTQAIVRACKKAGVPKWTANQLRHTRATEVRSEYDLETASAVLGHARTDTTEIYAETNFARAAEVMNQIG